MFSGSCLVLENVMQDLGPGALARHSVLGVGFRVCFWLRTSGVTTEVELELLGQGLGSSSC